MLVNAQCSNQNKNDVLGSSALQSDGSEMFHHASGGLRSASDAHQELFLL
jgi:hypothetical protein